MDLNHWLAGWAVRRAHVFIAELPGKWAVRAATQDVLAARGWQQAVSPADADVLAVCGVASADLGEVIGRIWDQLPGPRVRVDIRDVTSAGSELDRAAALLADSKRQRADARERDRSPEPPGDHQTRSPGVAGDTAHSGHDHTTSEDAGHARHEHMGHGDGHADDTQQHADHSAHQHGAHGAQHDMAHSGHEHMDHGEMDMAPAGIALAQGGEDRDGLEMDELHLRLGPFLAYWPAGLVVDCTLQGDVITAAEARVMGAAGDQPPQSRPERWMEAARQADYLVDLLVLAGWPHAAARARQLRKALLADPVDDDVAQKRAATLAALLRASRLLRWSLRDLAPLAAGDIEQYGLPAALAGDTHDRLLARLEVVQALIRQEADTPRLQEPPTAIHDSLPALIEGLDLATARLVIAGLGIETSPGEIHSHG